MFFSLVQYKLNTLQYPRLGFRQIDNIKSIMRLFKPLDRFKIVKNNYSLGNTQRNYSIFYTFQFRNIIIGKKIGMQDAFITTPILRSQYTSEFEKKLSNNPRQKINHLLKSFDERDLLLQAVNNIAVPKNFINTAYIENRPDEQLSTIYNTICALKKQVLRIKRYSDNPKKNNIFIIKSFNIKDQNITKVEAQKQQKQQFFHIKNQKSPEKKIKQAIIQELEYREKLQTRQEKLKTSEKKKAQFNQKRKQAAKIINKRSVQVYERQKQIQEKWFDKIINSQSLDTRLQSPSKQGFCTANPTKRQKEYNLVKKKMQQSKTQFQDQMAQQQIGRVLKQQSIKELKHRRLRSLNQRMNQKRLKSHQILQRKHIHTEQEQFYKINKMIQKQLKIKQNRQKKHEKDFRNSQSQMKTTKMMGTMKKFKNNYTCIINDEKVDQKENQIFSKINKKNLARQNFIKTLVDKIKQKHKIEDLRRQVFKNNQFKLLMQFSNNYSYIFQKDLSFANKNSSDSEPILIDPLEQNVKKKHENLLKSTICDQELIRLRKMPKSVLEKKLKDIKTKELREIFTQNIVKFLS